MMCFVSRARGGDVQNKEQRADPGLGDDRAEKDGKRFIPLESNPEVMNKLVYDLGLSRKLAFTDVYSIDDRELLAFVPRPSYALLLVFPVSELYEEDRAAEDENVADYEKFGEDEPVIWFKQTIPNACGMIGLLHAVANGKAREFVEPESELEKFLQQVVGLKPRDRAEMIYNSKAIESAHQAAACSGDTSAPSAEDEVNLHFVCFVIDQKENKVWELDGRRRQPICRGVVESGSDMLSEDALEVTVRRFFKREKDGGAKELRFGVLSLGPSLD